MFFIKAGFIEDFCAAVLKNAKLSVDQEDECYQFDVCQADKDKNQIFLYEVYKSKEAFDYHLASSHFADFNKLVASWVISKEISIFEKLD
jgi:quinol monooxygenase YgiN